MFACAKGSSSVPKMFDYPSHPAGVIHPLKLISQGRGELAASMGATPQGVSFKRTLFISSRSIDPPTQSARGPTSASDTNMAYVRHLTAAVYKRRVVMRK